MLKGILIATTDLTVVHTQLQYGAKALYLGDPMSVPEGIPFVKATLLVPDYNCLKFFVDNMTREYEENYKRLLSSPLAAESFASILTLLKNGTNVILYFPEENKEFNYAELLLKFIQTSFGVTAQTKSTVYKYNLAYNSSNARLMFMHNLINAVDFIIHTEDILDPDIDKLRGELPVEWGFPIDIPNDQLAQLIINKKNELVNPGQVIHSLMTRI